MWIELGGKAKWLATSNEWFWTPWRNISTQPAIVTDLMKRSAWSRQNSMKKTRHTWSKSWDFHVCWYCQERICKKKKDEVCLESTKLWGYLLCWPLLLLTSEAHLRPVRDRLDMRSNCHLRTRTGVVGRRPVSDGKEKIDVSCMRWPNCQTLPSYLMGRRHRSLVDPATCRSKSAQLTTVQQDPHTLVRTYLSKWARRTLVRLTLFEDSFLARSFSLADLHSIGRYACGTTAKTKF